MRAFLLWTMLTAAVSSGLSGAELFHTALPPFAGFALLMGAAALLAWRCRRS
jgi:hypothetical protein